MDVTTYELHSLQMTTSVLPSMLLGFRLRSFFTKFRGCSCVRCWGRMIKLDLLGSDKCPSTSRVSHIYRGNDSNTVTVTVSSAVLGRESTSECSDSDSRPTLK